MNVTEPANLERESERDREGGRERGDLHHVRTQQEGGHL